MTHTERHRVFRDTAIVAAITAALLLALPLRGLCRLGPPVRRQDSPCQWPFSARW